jgi:hypothetical protein
MTREECEQLIRKNTEIHRCSGTENCKVFAADITT